MNAAALIASRSALVFDLDGTLADTVTDLWLALNAALQEVGLAESDIALVRSSLHGGLPETARAAASAQFAEPGLVQELCRRYASHYRRRAHAASALYAGSLDLLDLCKRRQIPMAVCTNKSREEALTLLARLGIADRFDSVVGGDSARFPKPHPAPLLQALQALGTAPEYALLIGDSHVDAECAARAGVGFVLHAAGYGAITEDRFPAAARFFYYSELV